MATEKQIEYHRSFLSLFLCTKLYNEDANSKGARRVIPQAKEHDEVYKYHVHSCPIWPSEAPMQRRVYNAYIFKKESLEFLRIIAKRDQQFADYSTPWELEYSVLAGRGKYEPVLNEAFQVVGHVGTVTGNYFADLIGPADLSPDGMLEIPISTNALRQYLKDGVEVFVHNRSQPLPAGAIRLNPGSTQDSIQVVTQLNGQVVDFSVSSKGNVQSVDFFLLDLLGVGFILVNLGVKLGRSAIQALIKRASKGEALETAAVILKRAPKSLRQIKVPPKRTPVGNLNPKVRGQPETNIKADDKLREIHAANRFAERGDVDLVHLGDEARRQYNAPSGKFPDVVAKKHNGTFALSEGKGTDMAKVVQQFEAAKPKILAAEQARLGKNGKATSEISEQEVVIERLTPMNVDGGVMLSPGPGFGVDKQGFLLDARGHVDLRVGLPPRVMTNGQPIRVVTLEMPARPVQIQITD